MREAEGFMEKKIIRALVALGIGLLFTLTVSGTALAQETQVSGTVTSMTGERLPGVTVQVRGSTTTTTTDANGKYSIAAPNGGVVLFALIGYKGAARTIAGRPQIDVALESAVAVLEPVIVTGYTAQRRADITGSVSSVNVEGAQQQTSTSVLQRLDGRVPGVTVEAGGAPGSRTTVRVRGITGFQNNDPLYILDGTPVQESYLNFLNPNDIASMQVLKDGSAASIYGSRASNGVIIIETKKGRPGQRQVTLDVRTGVNTPTHGYDDILIQNSLDYFQVVKTSYQNAGLAVPRNIYGDPNNPSVPAYIWPNNCGVPPGTAPCTTVDPSTYVFPTTLIMPGSPGTNWWKAVFGAAQYRDANLALSGGGDDNAYHVSLSYLDQDGTAAFTKFQRGSARINTTFNIGRASIGENLSVSREQRHGAEGLVDDNVGEGGIVGKNIFQQPVVPIYDIGGHFASGKAVGLSNLTNPLKIASFAQHNIATNDRIFGNVFGTVDAGHALSLKTKFGFNVAQGSFHGYSPTTPENSEVTDIDGINENYSLFTEWTWSNTLNYSRTMNQHNLTVLLGQEAIKGTGRFEAGSCANLLNNQLDSRYIQDALCDPTTKNVSSSPIGRFTLLSFFGKADYNYGDRYYLSLTMRRDGSSKFGPTHRWGTFPAISAGWRLSRESFGQSLPVQNVMLRFGWGVTGNQNIPAGRIASQFGGGRGDTFYDIGGTGSSIRPGFKTTALGNPNLQWEENRSVNAGLDFEFANGHGNLTTDVYRRNTSNLLFDPPLPGTGGSADPPIVNIAAMRNTGIDFSIGYHSTIGNATLWSVTFNGSHYKNAITKIASDQTFFLGRGSSSVREQNAVRNQLGDPLGAFYGLVADGYYKDSLDAAPYWASGARPGRIKFKDLNGDGLINGDDRTIIGSPHPDFTGGLDLAVRHGAWDFSATVFGTFGNKIFNTQKYWYVFRYFDTNVAKDLLANSATLDGPCTPAACPGKLTNPDAKYPRVDGSDVFSRQWSSYWVEDGSYVRLRTLQIGYNLPPALVRWIPAARVYLQAENLFTITGYSGLDPALPVPNSGGPTGDIRDEARGIDQGTYPSNRTITIGISTTF